MSQARFPLGEVVTTANAMATLTRPEMDQALKHHESGNWGDLCPEDIAVNENGLLRGDRLLSVYQSLKGMRFWIITEWDRSITTILLPEDY